MASRRLAAGALALCVMIAACSDNNQPGSELNSTERPNLAKANSTEGTDFVIRAAAGAELPSDIEAKITAAGGKVTGNYRKAGVVIASGVSADFATRAAQIKGVDGVVQDRVVQWVEPDPTAEVVSIENAEFHETATGTQETFYNFQWAPGAISAPAAWAQGDRGKGARVAVLDGGIYSGHLDLIPNLDVAHSASFVPGQPFNADVGTFWHGTHVAGIVAAAANDLGTVGIAPEATIIGVKVLHNGTGSFGQVIAGIIYAATPIAEGGAGAHIINMSLGAVFDYKDEGGVELKKAMDAATKYARSRGVLVIASTGNDALRFDQAGHLISVPAQSNGVVGVSALGPFGWGLDPSVDLDRPASYTNYGKKVVGLAGPGGDFAWPGNEVCTRLRIPTGAPVAQFCWALDMVMSTVRGTTTASYSWAAGTSMASPAAAGVAALIVGKYGPMPPDKLEARLRQSADDLGKPGEDEFYGQGRINALRAVSQ